MTNPDDPRPVEPDQPTEIYHTADPYQAYGQQPPPNATMAFPTYQTYDPNQAPYQQAPYQQQPNPTQAYPTYQGGYQQQQPPQQGWGGYPGEAPPLEQTQEPKRKSKLWLGILVGLAVLAVGGLIAFIATSGSPETSTAGGAPTTARTTESAPTTAPRTPPRTSPAPGSPAVPVPPELGDAINGLGATVGTIGANDGSTLTVDGIGGSPVTVRTNDQTQVVAIGGAKVSDLKVGDSVVIQGDKAGDGSITARIIISTSLPNLDGFGR